MRLFIFISLTLFFFNCAQKDDPKTIKGYVVYIVPSNTLFVETKNHPDTNYLSKFSSSNLKSGFLFENNEQIKQFLASITTDTLFDENEILHDYASFARQQLIFPAELTIAEDISEEKKQKKKFKMIFKGNKVEFDYYPFKGQLQKIYKLSS